MHKDESYWGETVENSQAAIFAEQRPLIAGHLFRGMFSCSHCSGIIAYHIQTLRRQILELELPEGLDLQIHDEKSETSEVGPST